LGHAETQTIVANHLISIKEEFPHIPLVVNPAVRHERDGAVLKALKRDLLLVADVITPSIVEAEILTGVSIIDEESFMLAAEMLLTLGPKAVLLRGGDFYEGEVLDVFFTDSAQLTFRSPRLLQRNISGHGGMGGVIAAALAMALIKGQPYEQAISFALQQAKNFYLTEM
jgi:hydroxymethylpyrimidine/phosphomethylpyrimidine kinase